MSTEKKERKMTAKGFLHKSMKAGAKSAEGFIAAHRVWLETGDLAQFTSPILAKLDSKEVYPTPALEAIRSVVLGHMLAETAVKAEAAMAEGPGGTSKAWTATIFNAKGEVMTRKNDNTGEDMDLVSNFDSSSDADRWCDRRLFDGESDWFGTVVSNRMTRADGSAIATTILRLDAIARILAKPKGPACRKTGGSTSKLSFGMKAAVTTRATFSHG